MDVSTNEGMSATCKITCCKSDEPSTMNRTNQKCTWKSFSVFCFFRNQMSCQREIRLTTTKALEIDGEFWNQGTRKEHAGWKTMPFIFGNELCEKLAAIGLGANMITYLTQQLHMDTVKAANTLTNFGGTASLTPLFGAFLADAYAGRFWTITLGSIIYLMGMSLLSVTASITTMRPPPCLKLNGFGSVICSSASNFQLAMLYVAFLLNTLGSAGIRPCVSIFGADQFDQNDPNQEKKLWNFFNWYYFCMGLSALIAVTVIIYIQDNVGWNWGFGIPAIALAISILSFLFGMKSYTYVRPSGSPITRLARVLFAAFSKRNLPMPQDLASSLYEIHEKDNDSEAERLLHTDQFRFLDRAAIKTEGDVIIQKSRANNWKLCTVTEVEELKSILRMGPIWASGILLVTASAQQGTFAVLQAKTMDRRIGSSFQIPAGSMTVFSILALLITVPIYDRFIMPLGRRLTGHTRGISFLQRMGIGFIISTIATFVAALVERKRKATAVIHGLLEQPQAQSTIPISVFWLSPQYSLHGIAEAFMSVGHLEFFYDQSPKSMRSTAAALFWASISAGSYLSSGLVSIIHKTTSGSKHNEWLPNNLNVGHLDYFFWLLTALQFLNLIYFIICAHWYKYKSVSAEKHNLAQAEIKKDDAV
eukprot:c22655_g1_i1 orf=158-2101(-)